MPTAGAKKSAYVIHVGFAGRGHNRTADPGVELGESGDVGRERSHLLSVIHHDQVVARPHDLRRLEAEGRQEFDWRRTRLGRPGGKVQFEAVLFSGHRSEERRVGKECSTRWAWDQ